MIRKYSELNIEQVAKSKGYNIGPVYHGNRFNKTLKIFKHNLGKSTGQFYFTSDEELAKSYGKIIKAFLKIENPYKVSALEMKRMYMFGGNELIKLQNNVARFAKDNGFDGIIFPKGSPDENTFVVFNSFQIKSSDIITYDDAGNPIPLSERFNPNNPDMRY